MTITVAILLVVFMAIFVIVLQRKTVASFRHPLEERDPIDMTPGDFGMDYETLTLETADGLNLAAWYVPSQNRAAIIALHGSKSDRTVMLNIASILSRHGYGVIMVDLRTHGLSDGELISLGKFEQLDADAAYRYLLTRPDVDPERIGAFGNSMGASVLLMYAAENPKIKAVVSHCSFARAEDIGVHNLKKYTGLPPIPVLTFLVQFFAEKYTGVTADEVSVVDRIGRISPRPVFLMQGGQDEDSPSDSGFRLYAAAGEPRELWYEPEQEHVFFDRDYPEEFERRIVGFFDTYLLGENDPATQ